MLSDALFDANQAIQHYQETFPFIYDPIKAEIEEIKAAIEKLREKLDAPDSPEMFNNFPKAKSSRQKKL